MIRKQIYEKALALRGRISQMNVLVEECAELIKAIQKLNHRGGDVLGVIEELADVEIMCEQMRLIFSPAEIDKIKEQKLVRLEKLLCQ